MGSPSAHGAPTDLGVADPDADPVAPGAGAAAAAAGSGAGRRQGPRRARRRRRSVLLTAIAVVIVVVGSATVRFFVYPPLGAVARPQAVVVLDGYDPGPRLQRGLALARQDRVHQLVVSIPPGPRTPSCPPPTPTLQVTCFVPKPQSTQGEARAIAAFARVYGWHRLVVVSGTTQVTRASVRIGRCYHGQAAFSGVDPSGPAAWVYDVLYDEAAMVKAFVWQWGC